MANQDHLDLLQQGVEHWNEWRREHLEVRPDLSEAIPSGVADLRGADLTSASLRGADLTEADLRGADLTSASLTDVNLSEANLSEANLAGANFRGTYFGEANLSRANLFKTILAETLLSGANLSRTNLSEARLSRADLRGANLTEANLTSARLSRADLRGADLTGADLRGADLSRVIMGSTIIANVDLRSTRGLTEINHQGPSAVTLYSVQLPQDGSALHFLRGAGVPDAWITLYRAEMMRPIQYHSLFISYSNKDDTLARRLHADLQDHGVRCWFAPEDLKIGTKFRQRIDEAIHLQDKLLLLLSEHSIASTWVETEVEAALEKEDRQQRDVLFPIRLDDAVMQTSWAWAATLRRTRHIGDFTNWADPQAYQGAFDRLLRDLKQS